MRNTHARPAFAAGASFRAVLENIGAITIALALPLHTAIAQQASPATIAFGRSTFQARNGQSISVDTGTLQVPSNRAVRTAHRRTISLPIVRFPTTSANASPVSSVPIIYLSGGTGSGIAAARGARLDMFLAFRELGDVITLDLRGAGGSTPRVDCGSSAISDFQSPLTYPLLVDELSRQARKCADSLRHAGVDLAGHNVREVVEDIESLRQALGVSRIRLVGISTGSQLVLEYVRRHGKHVAQAVAAGVQAPDQNAHSPLAQQEVVRALSDALRQRDTTAAPALIDLLHLVLDSTSARPRTVAVDDGHGGKLPVVIGPFDVQLLVSATLGDRQQMALLPVLIGAAARGNYAPLAMMKVAAAKQGITSAYEALMDCQTGSTQARRERVQRESLTALLGMATLDFPEHCQAWATAPLGDGYRTPVRSTVPILLVSGTLDGRTPVSNAQDAIQTLPNASHLVVSGASHGDDLFLGSRGIVPTIIRFFRGEKLPRRLELSVQ